LLLETQAVGSVGWVRSDFNLFDLTGKVAVVN
jgi:hypothetical protein